MYTIWVRALTGAALAGFLFTIATPADARLGSFTPADGYDVQSADIRGDVSYYNSGAYGAFAGAGSGPTTQTADSGLWKVVGPAGGYFSNPGDRAAFVAQGVPYSASFANGKASYAVGGHSGGRTDNFNLALRNDIPLGTGAMVHEYTLDQYDLGVTPSSVISGPLSMGFYFCPNPGDSLNPTPDGSPADKFTMSIKDSVGQTFGDKAPLAASLVASGAKFGSMGENPRRTVSWIAFGIGKIRIR